MATITEKVSGAACRVGFALKKHSPEIFTVVGIVGVVASGVMACKATTKVDKVIDESKEKIECVHEALETGVTNAGEAYSEEDSKRDLAIIYVQTGFNFVKLYGPAIALGALSIGSIVNGHRTLRKRNIAIASAYTALNKDFKGYRSRVVERFGEELDRELRYNIKTEEVEVTKTDSKGKEKVVKQTQKVIDPNTLGVFTRIYDDGNTGWSKDPAANKRFLIGQQAFFNKVLETRGYVFFNEVLEALGFEVVAEGNVLGWFYDKKNPIGDNFIDFGIYDLEDEAKVRFINCEERSILLDFNVDGNILPYLPTATGNMFHDMFHLKR